MEMMDKIYEHAKHEKDAQALWKDTNTYAFAPNEAKKVFSIDTPPPTVSGTLHIGHVFSYTHADLIARYKRMKGYNVFYPMGFDDNGLPTERFVEKKNNTKAYLLKRSEFTQLCLKETADVEKLFETLWRSIGLSIDWTKLYSTISDDVRKTSQYSFIDLYNKNLIYRKQEPSLYCTTCRTSVAQAELDSTELASQFNDIVFTDDDGQRHIIATTRPELLPACVAVFFHPEDERYKHLAGTFMTTPVFEKKVKVIADEKVDPTKGTGLVMCCTFGDQTDIMWYKKHKLTFIQAIGLDGKWTAATGPLAGLNAHDARKKIIELLQETGTLLGQKSIMHNVSTHERCKQEIEYLILTQWFVNILDHKQTFIDLADKIAWKPEFMKARYRDWVQNLNWDWCISRQRYFGIPFPVWHCAACNHIILADPQTLPVDPQEKAYPGNICPKCSSANIIPDTDVMDTWNTSSLTPQINLHWPDASPDKLSFPMSMRPQAHDIIRTWAFYTIVKAYYHHGVIPWESIVMSGHVLAGKEKISKSKENSKTSPESLLAQFPADAIRYWAANGKLGTDTLFSENQIKIGQRLLTKLWNALRFCANHIDAHVKHTMQEEILDPGSESGMTSSQRRPGTKPMIESGDQLHQWIMHELGLTYKTYQQLFDAYEYHAALECAEKFFWTAFCDNYLELVKDQMFTPEKYDAATIKTTQATLYEISFALLQMFAPFIPHITETLYQLLFKQAEGVASIHISTFDGARFDYNFPAASTTVQTLLLIVAAVRKLKSESQRSLKADLQTLTIYTNNKELVTALQPLEPLITGITRAAELKYQSHMDEASRLVEEGGVLHGHAVMGE